MKYEVTLGIPVYNVEKYIRLTMDSALAQTFESIEFIVLDDCGTDDSIAIVREYQETHPRGKDIRIVRQPQNMGIGQGRNRIIDEAQGRYLYFMDADDEITPRAIELLYDNAQRYHAQIVYGSFEKIVVTGNTVTRTPLVYPSAQFLEGDDWPNYVYRCYDGIQAMTWNLLIDIGVFRQNGLRFKPIQYWEDFMLTMDLPAYITRAVLLPDVTYRYYCREGSLSHFGKRSHIDKAEVVETIEALAQVKAQSDRLRRKPYFVQRTYKVMETCYFVVCTVFRHQHIISPPFTKCEIRDIMRSPLSLREILSFRHLRWRHLTLYLFSVLPPSVSVALMKASAKERRLA